MKSGKRTSAMIAAVVMGMFASSTIAQVTQFTGTKSPASNTAGTNISKSLKNDRGIWNVKDVDVRTFIRAVAEETGKNFAVDPRVTGKVTFISTQPLNKEELYQAFLSVLQVNSFVALPSGTVTKIVPDYVAKGLSSPIYNSSMQKDGDAMAVSMVNVKFIPANDLATTLNQFLTPSGRIAAYAPSNDLMIADRAGNIVNLMRIIRQIDQPQASNISVIHLRNAQAKQLVDTLKPMVEQKTASGQAPAGLRGPSLSADERTNSILLSGGSPEQRSQVQRVIASLDVPGSGTGVLTEVIYLRHLTAERAATIVNGIIQNYTEKNKQTGGTDTSSMTSQSSSSTSSNSQQDQSTNNLFNTRLDQQGYSSGSSSSSGMGNTNINNDISTIVQRIPKSGSVSPAVQWEESTNSLVVTAPKELMRKIREVIGRLDIRRPQVLIEAVIAEVSERRQKELGIQWNPSGNVSFQTKFLPVLPLSFIGDNGKLATTAGGLNTVGQGISLTFNGNQIRFLLAALETDTDSNVLATPNLVTLDNEPAQIKVGEKISFSTSQITNSPTGGNPQSFFEREDVGLVLTINPQIAPNGAIKLLIQQELSAVIPGTSSSGGNPDTTERFIRTTVMADNGRVLVLGGLLQNEWVRTNDQVPVLGSIPYFGALFRDKSKSSRKTNLMIFLRPTILYDEKDDARVSGGKYEFLRQTQLAADSDNPMRKSYETPALPVQGEDVVLPSPFPGTAGRGRNVNAAPGEG